MFLLKKGFYKRSSIVVPMNQYAQAGQTMEVYIDGELYNLVVEGRKGFKPGVIYNTASYDEGFMAWIYVADIYGMFGPACLRTSLINLLRGNIGWFHPCMGKTYMHTAGISHVIDFDSTWKLALDKVLGTYNHVERALFKKENKPYYEEQLISYYKLALVNAQQQNKTLLVSDLPLLEHCHKDFDIIVDMPAELFAERSFNRGDRSDVSKWKSNIDEALTYIDDEKVITSTSYLSDLAIVCAK